MASSAAHVSDRNRSCHKSQIYCSTDKLCYPVAFRADEHEPLSCMQDSYG